MVQIRFYAKTAANVNLLELKLKHKSKTSKTTVQLQGKKKFKIASLTKMTKKN